MPSNIAAVAASFKSEILQAIHNFGAAPIRASSAADSLMAALYFQGTGLGYATTAYSVTGEVTGTGYTAGGNSVTNATAPAVSGPSAYWTPSASISWSGLTVSSDFDCWLLYNSSQGNRAIAVFTMPPQTIMAGIFTITMPVNAPGTGLLQVS